MNDDFESRLRALRPGKLPESLAGRLEQPPVAVSRRVLTGVFLAAGAAAALVMMYVRHMPPVSPVPGNAPVLAGSHESRVTGVRPLSLVTDSAHRTWRMLEVSWVEESTVVNADRPAAVRVEDYHRTVVPAPVDFY